MQTEKIIQHISQWIKNYAQAHKIESLVVGVSGGIDSASTAYLSALTGLKVILVTLPIRQNKDQVSLANKQCKQLQEKFGNVSHIDIDLNAVFENFVTSLPKDYDDLLTLANSRARLRMTTLYAVAGNNKGLVVGTGNKVEDFGIGFFTKYGDGGVDLNPIADLNKSQVRAVAAGLGVIPEIITAPPTDGLWEDDRVDEDQIGATYEQIEWAMEFYGDREDLNDEQVRVLDIYQGFVRKNEHKLNPIPVCLVPCQLFDQAED